jgi:hypothetical protein
MAVQRTFQDMVGKVAPSAPGCPEPVMIKYIREAAIEVCKRTLIWRYEQDLIRLTPGEYEYEYDTPDKTEVTGIIYSALNDLEIPFCRQEDLHAGYPDWPAIATTKRTQPQVISQFNTDKFVVAPVPDGDRTYDIKMFLALCPTPDATEMDKTIMDEVEEVIEHGALQHLLVISDRSWTDRELATYHAKQYSFKLGNYRAKTNLGVGRSSLRVEIPRFV